ncbi:unnamed protein product [Arctogadus glacialis]
MASFPKLDLVFIQTTQSGQDANDRKWCSEHSSSVGDTQPTTAPVPRELSAHTTVKELKREERVAALAHRPTLLTTACGRISPSVVRVVLSCPQWCVGSSDCCASQASLYHRRLYRIADRTDNDGSGGEVVLSGGLGSTEPPLILLSPSSPLKEALLVWCVEQGQEGQGSPS